MKKKLFKLDLKEFSNFQQSKKDDSQSTYVPKGQVSPHIKKMKLKMPLILSS